MFKKQLLIAVNIIAGCSLLASCSLSNASTNDNVFFQSINNNSFQSMVAAPHSIAGWDVNLQTENTVTAYTSGIATEGVTVIHYKKEGTWAAQGTGGANQQAYYGTYKYKRTSFNTAIDKGIDVSLHNTPYTTQYTFETPTRGKWVQDWGNGQIIFSGSFTMVPSNLPAAQHTAPDSITELNVALIIQDATSTQLPDGVYPKKGLALQTYAADGTVVIKGFGPKTLNSTGTYSYKKVSANTAVEETIQTSDLFVLPYTMVYTFDTPTSGRWFQNLGNGFIKFYGTFNTFSN